MAVQVTSPRLDSVSRRSRPIALLQVTDLGVHARIGSEDGVVWVTGASDGRSRRGAAVALHDAKGRVVARAVTDSSGLARLTGYQSRQPSAGDEGEEERYTSFQGYVSAVLGTDRALLGINDYDPDLSPWRFNVSQAWGASRLPVAGAVFTERGIYRPGEPLFAKAIVRTGPLGALTTPRSSRLAPLGVPGARGRQRPAGRAARHHRCPLPVRHRRPALHGPGVGPAGRVPRDHPASSRRDMDRHRVHRLSDRGVSAARVPGGCDRRQRPATSPGIRSAASVEARYLFGAPMGRAAVRWTLRQQSTWPG